MKNTMQTDSQSVYEHGESVWRYTKKIICKDWDDMKIPEWFKEYHFDIVNNSYNFEIIKRYNIYHDCGKPFCLEIGSEGKRHFPNHESISKEIWLKHNPEDLEVANLIGNDMLLHSKTSKELDNFIQSNPKQAVLTLLITAFAEIHSNAEMFGGIESTSFKIKWKKLNQRGKQILKTVFVNKDNREFCYVIVRKDMSPIHTAIQGTHAAIEQARRNAGKVHPSVIYVTVKNENKLKKVCDDLIEQGINFTSFTENFGLHEGQMTAIATEFLPDNDKRRLFMKKFQLLK